MDITIEYTSDSVEKNISYEFRNNNTYLFCISPPTATFYADAMIEYWNTSYSIRNYYLVNASLTNTTSNISLYLVQNFSNITVYVRDEAGIGVEDVIVKAQRYFIGTNTYLLVAEIKTDFQGRGYIRLKPEEWYRFVLEKDNVILRDYSPMYLDTSITTLSFITKTIEIPTYWSYWDKIAWNCNYNNDTRVLSCSVTDTSGLMNKVWLNVTQIGLLTTNRSICNEYSTSSSVTLVCTLPENNQNKTYTYQLTAQYTGSILTYLLESGSLSFYEALGYGLVGVFAAFFLILTLGYAGSSNPATTILFSMFGVAVSYILGLITFGVSTYMAIVGLFAAGGIIIYKLRT